MRKNLPAVAALIPLLLASEAAASNWSHFANCGSASQQRTYWYDTASIRPSGQDKLVRVRGDYSQVAGSVAARADILWSVNCASGTFSERSRTERDAKGRIVAKYTRATRTMDASAESVARKLINRVCS
jgi:hypothetical protein